MEVYDGHIHPLFMSLRDGLTEITDKAITAYNTYILPVIEELAEKFAELKENVLSPLIDKFGDFIAKVADSVKRIWNETLKPFVEQFIEKYYPVIAEVIRVIGGIIYELGKGIGGVISGILDALGGLVDFLTGVFTGDWELAWEGIKEFFAGVWDSICVIGDTLLNALSVLIESAVNGIANTFHNVWEGIKAFFAKLLDDMLNKVDAIFPGMKDIILKILTAVKTFISNTMNTIFTNVSNVLNRIKTVWSTVFGRVKDTTTNIFNGVWNIIKKVINSILGGIETMANGIVRGINRAIEAMNCLSFSIPDWVPEIGGMSFGFDIPELPEISIPKLAQGAFVKPNTPQLAMIGDNRHQGEIVAPEDKLYQVSAQAMQDVMQQFITALKVMGGTAQRAVTIVLKVTGEMAPFVRLLKTELEKEDIREGINFEVVYE